MFGESVFALIPDHEVRAAKLTNRSWDEHLVVTKHALLKCRSVRRRPPGQQWSRRETVEARGTKWNFDVAPRPDEGTSTAKAQVDIPTVPPNAPPPEVHVPEVRPQGVHVKVLRIGAL